MNRATPPGDDNSKISTRSNTPRWKTGIEIIVAAFMGAVAAACTGILVHGLLQTFFPSEALAPCTGPAGLLIGFCISAYVTGRIARELIGRSMWPFKILLLTPGFWLLPVSIYMTESWDPKTLSWVLVFGAIVLCPSLFLTATGFKIGKSVPAVDKRHCATCSYDLTGNVSGRCPECGTPVDNDRHIETL